jgi:hypothetical protein
VFFEMSNKDVRISEINFLGSDDYKTIALATKTNRQFLKNTFLQHLICPK